MSAKMKWAMLAGGIFTAFLLSSCNAPAGMPGVGGASTGTGGKPPIPVRYLDGTKGTNEDFRQFRRGGRGGDRTGSGARFGSGSGRFGSGSMRFGSGTRSGSGMMRFGSGTDRGNWQNAFSGVADEDRSKIREMTEALRSGDADAAKRLREELNAKYPNLFRSGAEMPRGRRGNWQNPGDAPIPGDAQGNPEGLPQ